MTVIRSEEAKRLREAVEQTWRENASLVKGLHLQFRPELIEQLPEGWAVHVGVGSGDQDAYDIVNALDQINRSVRSKSGLFVIVLYDPGFDFTPQGPRPFANGEKTNGIRP
jgi:hypothetical protein